MCKLMGSVNTLIFLLFDVLLEKLVSVIGAEREIGELIIWPCSFRPNVFGKCMKPSLLASPGIVSNRLDCAPSFWMVDSL